MKNQLVVIGNFGSEQGNCGQTIKTNVIYSLLKKERSGDTIAFDTSNLKSISKIFYLLFVVFRYDKFVILPAQKALPILACLFYIFNKKADYIVIGGWLPEYLMISRRFIKKAISSNFRIFVETRDMTSKLIKIGIKSYVLPNFKTFVKFKLESVLEEKEKNSTKVNYVYVGRVIKEKGLIDSINALYNVASNFKDKQFNFDIYGPLDNCFESEFKNAIKKFKSENLIVTYKGFVSPNKVQETLVSYNFFLFPTYYEGEGFPGCLIDAMASGVPIIASDWKYNKEIVKSNENGYLYKSKSVSDLTNVLSHSFLLSPKDYKDLVSKCLIDAVTYHEDNVKLTMEKYNFFVS